ncbi:MAG: hypothetical protein ACXVHY_03320 [Methanobacterium sp.]
MGDRSLWRILLSLILISGLSMIFVSSLIPTYSANPANASVSVTVGPTISIDDFWNNSTVNPINLGILSAGSNYTFIGNETLRTYSNVPINVTIRVSGPLTGINTSNTIDLLNFQYFNNYTGSYRSFNTTATLFNANWAKAPKGSYNEIPINLLLILPTGQDPDTYNCTITYTATQA